MKYYVVNEFGETYGEAWVSRKTCAWVTLIPTLGRSVTFPTLEDMVSYLWDLGLDIA